MQPASDYMTVAAMEGASDRASSSKIAPLPHGGGPRRARSYIPNYRPSEINPFINSTISMPLAQRVKMALLLPILCLRLALSGVNVLCMYFFSLLVTGGLKGGGLNEPLPAWRAIFKYPICWCIRWQLFLFGFLWVKVTGRPVSKREAPILVCNHVSPFEPLYLVSLTQATPVQRSEDSMRR